MRFAQADAAPATVCDRSTRAPCDPASGPVPWRSRGRCHGQPVFVSVASSYQTLWLSGFLPSAKRRNPPYPNREFDRSMWHKGSRAGLGELSALAPPGRELRGTLHTASVPSSVRGERGALLGSSHRLDRTVPSSKGSVVAERGPRWPQVRHCCRCCHCSRHRESVLGDPASEPRCPSPKCPLPWQTALLRLGSILPTARIRVTRVGVCTGLSNTSRWRPRTGP